MIACLQDRYRLPLSWHQEFWIPSEVSEEELGFALRPMGQSLLTLKSACSSSKSTSIRSSRSSSKRNSFRAGLKDTSRNSRCSSFKRSRPESICLSVKSTEDSEWEWVWETDEEEEEEETPEVAKQLEQVTEIIADPEEKWRHLSKTPEVKPSISVQAGVEENDPMSLVKVVSAKQWKQISRKLTINFDDLEGSDDDKKVTDTEPTLNTPTPDTMESVEDRLGNFIPTTVQELRRLCWQIKPWDHPPQTFAERQLFTSILGSAWGVDADEVFPRILIGDQAAARNIAFLKRFGISHVLNAAEGPWAEHCVDLSEQHYHGTDISYLVKTSLLLLIYFQIMHDNLQGLPLFDSTEVRILPYLGIAADFIRKALEEGKKCLVNCQMGVSRSASCAMAYLMIYQEMNAIDILRAFRKRRDVR